MTFRAHLEQTAETVEQRLGQLLAANEDLAAGGALAEAMRYAALGGGKRLRPFLLIQSAALFGVTEAAALDTACALE
jgi:farnesyl diphosphate synthase